MADAKKASLTVLGGPLAGARCVLPDGGVVSVGSAEGSTLRLDLPGVSPFHARIVVEHGSVTVFETGAERHVHVNDNPVGSSGTALRNGDILWLGTPGDDDVVMLQCVLPRRAPAEAAPSDSSPDVTLAAVPLPSELPAARPAEPTPLIETTALDLEHGRAVAAEVSSFPEAPVAAAPVDENETVMLQGGGGGAGDDELVFADEAAPAAPPAIPFPQVEAEPGEAEGASEATAHVVVPDFESAVFVEPEPTYVEAASPTVIEPMVGETTIAPNYEPLFDAPSAPEPTEFVAPDETPFEEAIDEPAAPPPIPAAVPPPVPAAPRPATPPADRSQPGMPRPSARPAGAAAPPHASQRVVRRPDATHGPGRHVAAPVRKKGGPGGLLVAGGLVGLLVVVAGGYFAWRLLAPRLGQPAPPAPPVTQAQAAPITLSAPPPTDLETPAPDTGATPEAAAATPTPEATPAAVPTPQATATPRGSPSPSPRATPSPSARPTAAPPATAPAAPVADTGAAQRAAQAQSLLQEAETALAARQYDAAIGSADGVLRLEPGHARASALKAEATRRRDLSRRRFVAGRTNVQTEKKAGGLTGFETDDADLRRAPDFQGRIEFEMSPATGLEAGTPWTLRIFVVNEGKKAIRVQGVSVGGAPTTVRVRDIAPQQRAQVGETSGVWAENTNAWSTDAAITANKGDSLRNTLTWR